MQPNTRRIRQFHEWDDHLSVVATSSQNSVVTVDHEKVIYTSTNDENACPNVVGWERTDVAKIETFLNETDEFVNHDSENSNKNKDRNKESRRKLMLQKRRMEKASSQRSTKLISKAVVVTSAVGQEINDPLLQDTKGRIYISTILPRFVLMGLSLYHVQLHSKEMAYILSSMTEFIRSHWNELLTWIVPSSIFSKTMPSQQRTTMTIPRFDNMSIIPCEKMLHITFVIVLFGKGLYVSSNYVRQRFSQQKGTVTHLKCVLLFLLLVVCWIMIIPVYNRCEYESNKHCIVVTNKHISSPRYSWLDVVIIRSYNSLSIFIKSRIKGRLFKEARQAFINPFKFCFRLKKIFTIIRWTKFLAPLIGTCNKLRGHISDMLKKKGQHITSQTARRMWYELIEALMSRSKQERAVLQLQRSFREKREYKAKRRMDLISSQRHSAKHIRKRLLEERVLSKSKLIKMEMIDSERQLRRQVSEQEKITIAKYRETRKRDKRRLLLSPKTAFAVGWKCVAICCVILEIMQWTFAPLLSGELKKMPLDELISILLFASCTEREMQDVCVASAWKHKWLMTVHILSRVLMPLVHVVCFLDVFITFSTGELTASGKLVPKPFFARYILPGVGLQLIVNPTMVAISKLTKKAILHFIYVGPSLYFHSIMACLPLAYWIYGVLLDVVLEFVEQQNNTKGSRSLKLF